MRRRQQRVSGKERFVEKIKREHSLFKFGMLSGCRREIYENCNKIRFYEVLYEYFLYRGGLEESLIREGMQTDDFMGLLYAFYLKHENLSVGTWEETEEFLGQFLERRQQRETGTDAA